MLDKTQALYAEIKDKLDEYVSIHSENLTLTGFTIPIEGDKALKVAHEVLELQETHLKDAHDNIQTLLDEKKKLEERAEQINKEIDGIQSDTEQYVQERGALMNRLSPMLKKQVEGQLTEWQEINTIALEDGKPVMRITDWISAFVNSRRKQAVKKQEEEKKAEEKASDVSPKIQAHIDEDEE